MAQVICPHTAAKAPPGTIRMICLRRDATANPCMTRIVNPDPGVTLTVNPDMVVNVNPGATWVVDPTYLPGLPSMVADRFVS